MTNQMKYNIPTALLDHCPEIKERIDQKDYSFIQHLLTLYSAGFTPEEIQSYIGEASDVQNKKTMLEKKRMHHLENVHRLEKQIAQLDYLRFTIKEDL